MSSEQFQRAVLSVEGLAMGDAYGNHHGKNQRKRAAQLWEYSDDTIMALSILEILRKYGEINQDALAASFALHWNGQRGYGRGATRLLKRIREGDDWRKAAKTMFDGQGSLGNGAAMRVTPVGAYFAGDMNKVVEQSKLSATVTHTHIEGVAGAIAVAVATALAYQYRTLKKDVNRQQLLSEVLPYVPESEVRDKIKVALELDANTRAHDAAKILGNGRPALAQLTVPFTLWAASGSIDDYERAIRQTASVQGDVDTNCAIVGGIVVMHTGIEAIPSEWIERREGLLDWAMKDSP